MTDPDLLRAMFDAALAAADPGRALPPALPPRPEGRVLALGAGKASARMAQALEEAWGPVEGLVAVPHGATLPTTRIELVETAHPVPDAASEDAARRMLAMAGDLVAGDTLVALISGGGSALLAAPQDGLTLADKQAVTRALLRSGAPISEMNAVRRRLSAVKGGGLARAAAPACVLTFIVSDVPGDDPALVASGPTIAATSNGPDPADIVRRWGIELPEAAHRLIAAPPPPDTPSGEVRVIASAQMALEAAAEVCRQHGVTPLILGDAIEGEAREVGRVMAGIAHQVARHGQPAPVPLCLLSGGETTVTLRAEGGRGGRCSEFLLAFALAADGLGEVAALACDTDGRDGSEHNAGAIWVGSDPFDRIAALSHLDENDAWSFFAGTGGLVETGPTHTNVNDFRAVLVRG
ncbi:glycerate 2-kinase [Palleronia marisminoris]|uniref:Putative hydroxypyruvate reductase n=1 Tax=Palleronia marisminoris TaxID=315423 RepID=A0A1Y5T286_9RHOB|nr:glycerate kinase [Palleronia marisminoris]SFH08918.1 glycerate 2-kinase [Palleronia marisminoris]SLN52366.1 Putative hydroxypyruvate reductase [Palleronia marisminoris]